MRSMYLTFLQNKYPDLVAQQQDQIQSPLTQRPVGWKRKCKLCGKDPWPNYNYCYTCFNLINQEYCNSYDTYCEDYI